MNLLDVIRDLDEHTIYAQQPWRPASMAIVVQDQGEGDPEEPKLLDCQPSASIRTVLARLDC